MSERDPIEELRDALKELNADEIDKEQFGGVSDDVGREIGRTAFGECDYPSYCKFYGENPSFCDRSCSIPVWDQI